MDKITTVLLSKRELTPNQTVLITNLINTVYENSEREFWPTDGSYSRTTIDEISSFVEKEELIVAKEANEIVGTVHVYPINSTTLGFGMLTVSLQHRKKGIGNVLLKAVEVFAKTNKFSKIQLELLKPLHFKHQEKEFLEKWYCKNNYELTESITHENLYFKQATMLKFPCKFDIFTKTI